MNRLAARILRSGDRALYSASQLWEFVVEAYRLLEPVRGNVLLALLVAVAFLFVPQGHDLLAGLADDASRGERIPAVAGMFLSLAYLCTCNWYWPRFLLDCNFYSPPSEAVLKPQWRYQLRLHTPRLLGLAPALAVGWSFWTLRGPANGTYTSLALISFLLGVGLYVAFVIRRRLMGVSLRGVESPADGHSPVDHERIAPKGFKSLRDVSKDRGALWGFATFGGPPLILFVCFLLIPVSAGQILGSAAVVLLGLASLGCFGAGILYFGHRYNLPTGLILIILAVCAHWTNDNHQIRHLDTPIVRRDLLEERLDAWHKHATDSDGSAKPTSENSKHPLFIVATEGGGIRAAYWTSLVLSGLEDFSIKQHERRFSDHLFAISGVSGGSFGGAAYTAFIADPKNGVSFADRTHAFLGQEYLGPLVGRMLFTDSLQRFCPLRVSHFDRASSFEIAWEEAWRGKDVHGDSPRLFSNGFAELYRDCSDRKIWLPGLFLNGTNVETGGRIITSSWDFKDADGSTFVNAIDGVTKMEAPLRMSTAAHSSARFTYFNPPGRYPDGTHVVDGGYFENSGGQTAHDILARVLRKMWSDPTWHDVEPHLIIIRNGLDVPSTPEAQAAAARRLRENHSLSELLAPLATLWNTRTAHAESSLRELEEQPILAATLNPHETAEKNEGNGSWTVFPHHEFFLLNESTSVPLGWALSNTAIEEMHRQFLQRERGQAVQSILTTLKFSYVGISQ